jgi:Fe-S-cluster containining protein
MSEPAEEHTPQKEPPGAAPPDWGDDDLDDDDDLFETATEIKNECRCGECCRNMIIDVDVEDAKREPKIAERGSPLYTSAEFTDSGQRELEGYNLNDKTKDYACTFLDTTTNLCSIYETRPWVCRLFDCDGEQRDELVQLGILPPRGQGRGR